MPWLQRLINSEGAGQFSMLFLKRINIVFEMPYVNKKYMYIADQESYSRSFDSRIRKLPQNSCKILTMGPLQEDCDPFLHEAPFKKNKNLTPGLF